MIGTTGFSMKNRNRLLFLSIFMTLAIIVYCSETSSVDGVFNNNESMTFNTQKTLTTCSEEMTTTTTTLITFSTSVDIPDKYCVSDEPLFCVYMTWPGTNREDGIDPVMDDDLISLIDNATSSIDMAVFSFDKQNIINALTDAHNRGVTLRLVGDKGVSLNDWSYGYEAMDSLSIETTLRDNDIIEQPYGYMHNKFMIIDSRYVFTGSTNFTENGFLVNNNNSVLIESIELANSYRNEFEQMLSGTFSIHKTDCNISHSIEVGGITVEYYFGPYNSPIDKVIDKLDTADYHINFLIYALTNADMSTKLIEKAEEGISISSIWDEEYVGKDFSQANNLYEYIEIRKDGNHHYGDYGGAALHHKIMIIDCETDSDPAVMMGSCNWTSTGNTNYDENLLVIHNQEITNYYKQEYNRHYGISKVYYPYKD